MTENIKEVIKDLKKGYGKRCKDIDLDCWSCRAWIVIDFLEEEIEMNEDNLKGKI